MRAPTPRAWPPTRAARSRTTSASTPGHGGDPFGGVLGDEGAQLVDDGGRGAASTRVRRTRRAGRSRGAGRRGTTRRCRAGSARCRRRPRSGRLDPARVDEHDPGAAGGGAAQLTQDVGDRVEAGLRRPRVLADDEAQVGVLEVGDRVHRRRPEHGLAGDELVGAVLRARGERAADAERPSRAPTWSVPSALNAVGLPM